MLKNNKLLAGIAFVAAVLCCVNTLDSDFITDDFTLIVENDYIKGFGHLKENLTRDYFFRNEVELPVAKVGYYRPITKLSFMTDYSLWKLKPFGYHLTNLVLHGSVAALAFFFFVSLGAGSSLSFGAALLFAVSPIHAEPVSIVCARSDLFLALFYLASMISFARHREKPNAAWLSLSLFLSFMSYLSKEMAVTLPVALVLFDVIVKKTSIGNALKNSTLHFLSLAVYLVLRFHILDIGMQTANETMGLWSAPWFFLLLQNVLFSLAKGVLPIHVDMTNCSGFLVPLASPGLGVIAALVLLLAAIFLTWWVGIKRLPLYTLLMGMFFLSIAPLAKFDAISGQSSSLYFFFEDRWLYLPSVFTSMAFPMIFEWALRRVGSLKERTAKALYAVLLAGTGAAFFAQTWQRNKVFKNDGALFAVESMQTLYLADMFPDDRQLQMQKKLVMAQNEKSPERALEIYGELLREQGHDQRILSYMAAIYFRLGDWERARDHYIASLVPKKVSTPDGDMFVIEDLQNRNRGEKHFALAMSYYHLKSYDESLKHFELARKYGFALAVGEATIASMRSQKGEQAETSTGTEDLQDKDN